MAESFFIFTMGPIQDFIASARRCHDLWYGSWLLSHLAGVVAEVVKKECVTEALIFPGSEELDDKKGISNKIVAIVSSSKVEGIAKAAKTAVLKELSKTLEKVMKEALDSNLSEYLLDDKAREQVEDMMEFFWVAVPCADREGQAYADARDRAEELLAARKNLHDWNPVTWGDYVPKSSLDGNRESVIRDDFYDLKNIKEERKRRLFGVGKKERLCGVALLKRLGGSDKERIFHSTAHIAAAILEDYFEKQEVKDAFDQYIETLIPLVDDETLTDDKNYGWLSQFRLKRKTVYYAKTSDKYYDGAVFFENRLIAELPGVLKGNEKKTIVQKIRTALKTLFNAMKQEDKPAPYPNSYYALLLADGDRMGKIIDEQKSFSAHKKISGILDGFSGGVRGIVEKHKGSLIYSGGDDVLALLPMHKAVQCARELADDFKGRLKDFAFFDEENKEKIIPTLSVGIAIAHSLKPFGRVREQAKKAERLAKTTRNALAIIIDKRSGGSRSIRGSWDVTEELEPLDKGLESPDKGLEPLDKRLKIWKDMIEQNDLNHGFLYEVESIGRFGSFLQLSADLEPEQGKKDLSKLSELLQHELERVMARKEPGQVLGLSEETRKALNHFLKQDAHNDGMSAKLQALSNELYFALEMHRAEAVMYKGEES